MYDEHDLPLKPRHNIVWGLKDGSNQKKIVQGHRKTRNELNKAPKLKPQSMPQMPKPEC